MRIAVFARRVILAASVIAVHFSAMAQGNLTPPGAPGPTMKTLDQIEARIPISATTTPGDGSDNFVISKPGSYYLTTNFISSSGKGGIRIETNNVTIDLNGFAVDGAGIGGQGIRIITSIHRQNIKVLNGTVCNWHSAGIDLSFGQNTLLEKVLVAGNAGNGILTGENSVVRDCLAYTNATLEFFLIGIAVGQGSIVENCAANFNGNDGGNCTGISIGSGSTVSHCSASQNNGPNATGISTGPYCTVKDCVTSFATGTNGVGISLGSSSSAIHCNASGNSGAGTTGIVAGQHSLVEECVANFNGGDGIQASDNCSLISNKCDNNLNTGIHTTGQRNRIDGNAVVFNISGGIKVDSNLNLVVRNSATGSGGLNFVIAAGNNDAERLSGGTAFTSTNPWANFSF